jgi:hypothetical protein
MSVGQFQHRRLVSDMDHRPLIERRIVERAPEPTYQPQYERVYLEARTREYGEKISPTRVRQVIVSPVREQREQYRIAPADEHYTAYVYADNEYPEEIPQGRSSLITEEIVVPQGRVVKQVARPVRMSYS